MFGLKLWPGQEAFLWSIVRNLRVAVRSGHKVGKSLAVAVAAWWWALTRNEGRVIITAPTDRQVRRIVWREIRALYRKATQRGYVLPMPALAPDTGVQFEAGGEIIGFATDVPENIAGFSGPEVLWLVDEASGVPRVIFDAIEGNMAGGAHLVLISNPTQTTGQFFEAFHRERAIWCLLHLSSEQCAKWNQRHNIPGLALWAWVEDRRKVWGKTDQRYQVRVVGKFPSASPDTVITLELLEAAYMRWGSVQPTGHLQIGVDVARFGSDDSVIRPVCGLVAYPARQVHGYDSIQVAGAVKELVTRHRAPHQRAVVVIDAGGGYGGGVADQLRAWLDEGLLGQKDAVEILEIHPSSTADDPVQFDRRRDELWFGVRHWLENGGAIDNENEPAEVEEDLLAPKYAFAPRSSAIKVQSKDEIKKTLGRSPDNGDAFALACLPIITGLVDPANDVVVGSRYDGANGTFGY